MTKILPLPVKKNKFGERVANISLEKYYRQIMEEVIEVNDADNRDAKAEELVDVIACCITRLDIMHWYEDGDDFGAYVDRVIKDACESYRAPKDFYVDLAAAVMQSYHAAKMADVFDYLRNEGCGSCAADISEDCDEEGALGNIIVMCIKRLEKLGYDESDRQKIYQAINEKNRKRGYFEE